MNFNKHSELAGKHAFLGASKYHWVNYSDDKLREVYTKALAAADGTDQHELAAHLIRRGVKLPSSRKTLNMYVNEAIGFRMTPEQTLFYSFNCFGTADAISFRRNVLRIHDLKTGTTTVTFKQLEVYAAIFCLEYDIKPGEIEIELRIYQNDDVKVHTPILEEIIRIMSVIQSHDVIIDAMRAEAYA